MKVVSGTSMFLNVPIHIGHQRYWFWLGGGSLVFSVPLQGWAAPILSNNSGWDTENQYLKKNFHNPPPPPLYFMTGPLFRLIQLVKGWQILLELNSKGLYQSSGKEKESCFSLRCRPRQNVKLGTFKLCSCNDR